MSDAATSLDEVLERTGFYARARERNTLAIAKNLISLGIPIETIASATLLDIEKVKTLTQEEPG